MVRDRFHRVYLSDFSVVAVTPDTGPSRQLMAPKTCHECGSPDYFRKDCPAYRHTGRDVHNRVIRLLLEQQCPQLGVEADLREVEVHHQPVGEVVEE